MPKQNPILVKIGDLVGIAFIKMHLNFYVKILNGALLVLQFTPELGIQTSDWTSD
jgi:hypothetical protein